MIETSMQLLLIFALIILSSSREEMNELGDKVQHYGEAALYTWFGNSTMETSPDCEIQFRNH